MKTILILTALLVFATQVHARVELPKPVEICLPVSQFGQSPKLMRPDQVDELLRRLKREIGPEKLEQLVGLPVLESLDNYSRMDKRDIYANFAAAVAGGAAVAVVEHVWDRYVGNGGSKTTISPREFDLSSLRNQMIRNPQNFQPSQTPLESSRQPQLVPAGANNPYALTHAVAVATAGAVAYKAVEYGMNKVFGSDRAQPRDFDQRQFDLRGN